MNKFQAFKETLSAESLKAIYDETRLEVANDEREGTEAFFCCSCHPNGYQPC